MAARASPAIIPGWPQSRIVLLPTRPRSAMHTKVQARLVQATMRDVAVALENPAYSKIVLL